MKIGISANSSFDSVDAALLAVATAVEKLPVGDTDLTVYYTNNGQLGKALEEIANKNNSIDAGARVFTMSCEKVTTAWVKNNADMLDEYVVLKKMGESTPPAADEAKKKGTKLRNVRW